MQGYKVPAKKLNHQAPCPSRSFTPRLQALGVVGVADLAGGARDTASRAGPANTTALSPDGSLSVGNGGENRQEGTERRELGHLGGPGLRGSVILVLPSADGVLYTLAPAFGTGSHSQPA